MLPSPVNTPHRTAALKWLSAAPSPQASTAAVKCAFRVRFRCPTAYTPPVKPMEPPPLHPPINRVIAQPPRLEVRATDDPMLPARELRDRPIRWVLSGLTAHVAVKSDRSPVRPPRRGSVAAYVDSRADAAA